MVKGMGLIAVSLVVMLVLAAHVDGEEEVANLAETTLSTEGWDNGVWEPKQGSEAVKEDQYYADGRNERINWAKSYALKDALQQGVKSEGRDLGESSNAEMGAMLKMFSSHSQHQPLKIKQAQSGGTKCVTVNSGEVGKLAQDGTVLTPTLGTCRDETNLFYNRFTKRLEFPDHASPTGGFVQKCLTRKEVWTDPEKATPTDPAAGPVPAMYIRDCELTDAEEDQDASGSNTGCKSKDMQECQGAKETCLWNADQIRCMPANPLWAFTWDFDCDAFFYDQRFSATETSVRILSGSFSGVNGQIGPTSGTGSLFVTKWYAYPEQKWIYPEVVRHSRCRTKRYKTLAFDGTLQNTISFSSFMSWPDNALATGVTVMMWAFSHGGSPMSYSTTGNDNVPVQPQPDHFAIEFNKSTRKIEVYMFATMYATGVEAPLGAWFHIAVTYDKQASDHNLKLWIDGTEVWKARISNQPLLGGGCIMLGQRAKKPCRQRMPETSYKGQVADMLIFDRALSPEDIETFMFKPVDPKYLATINEAPQKLLNPPTVFCGTGGNPACTDGSRLGMKVAYLTRQYGSQEISMEYPPVCQLEAEEEEVKKDPSSSKMYELCRHDNPKWATGSGGLNFAAWKGECAMDGGGDGDVHYRGFRNCKYDDQAVGGVAAIQMLPDWYASYPMSAQFFPTPWAPLGSWASKWANKPKVLILPDGTKPQVPGQLSMVSACAAKYDNERIAVGVGGFNFPVTGSSCAGGASFEGNNAGVGNSASAVACRASTAKLHNGGNWGTYSSCSDYEQDGNLWTHGAEKVTFGTAGNTHTSRWFTGWVTGGGMDIQHQDGMRLECSPAHMRIWVPRIIEAKFGGMLGRNHIATSMSSADHTDHGEWTCGPQLAYIDAINKGCASGSSGYKGMAGAADKLPLVPWKQVPNLVSPTDGGNTCRPGGQCGNSGSSFNGNRPWKGITKMFYSWRSDGTVPTSVGGVRTVQHSGEEIIPNIFGSVYGKMYDGPGKYWDYLTPASGTNKNKPKGAAKVAEQECSVLVKFKKNYKDCLFDFVAMGKAAVEKNLKLVEEMLAKASKTPTLTTVRDVSGLQQHAKWVGHPNWGCVDGFSSHLSKEFARREAKKHHDAMCKCVPGTGTGTNPNEPPCAYRHFVCIVDIESRR